MRRRWSAHPLRTAVLLGLAIMIPTNALLSTQKLYTMSYSRPNYITEQSQDYSYNRILYRHSKTNQSGDEDITLFIHGNKGHYKQMRSLASDDIKRHSSKRLWIALDMLEETSALSGLILLAQASANAQYLVDLGIESSERRYEVIGHSMGGIVARLALSLIDYDPELSNVITLGDPFPDAALITDFYMQWIYWKLRKTHEPAVSIHGGLHDRRVPIIMKPEDHLTTYMTRVGMSVDHEALLWCNEVVRQVTDLLDGDRIYQSPKWAVDQDCSETCSKSWKIRNGINHFDPKCDTGLALLFWQEIKDLRICSSSECLMKSLIQQMQFIPVSNKSAANYNHVLFIDSEYMKDSFSKLQVYGFDTDMILGDAYSLCEQFTKESFSAPNGGHSVSIGGEFEIVADSQQQEYRYAVTALLHGNLSFTISGKTEASQRISVGMDLEMPRCTESIDIIIFAEQPVVFDGAIDVLETLWEHIYRSLYYLPQLVFVSNILVWFFPHSLIWIVAFLPVIVQIHQDFASKAVLCTVGAIVIKTVIVPLNALLERRQIIRSNKVRERHVLIFFSFVIIVCEILIIISGIEIFSVLSKGFVLLLFSVSLLSSILDRSGRCVNYDFMAELLLLYCCTSRLFVESHHYLLTLEIPQTMLSQLFLCFVLESLSLLSATKLVNSEVSFSEIASDTFRFLVISSATIVLITCYFRAPSMIPMKITGIVLASTMDIWIRHKKPKDC